MAGERPASCRQGGRPTVSVVLRDTDDADLLREALIENIHRQDLGPIELAEAFRQLLEDLGLKQEALAERVGVSRSHIANTIRLLQLPSRDAATPHRREDPGRSRPGVAVARRPRSDEHLGAQGRRRGPLGSARRRTSYDAIEPPAEPTAAPTDEVQQQPTDSGMAEIEEILSEQLATRVQIQYSKKRGRVVIEFGSVDDLDRIVSEIVGSGPGLAPDSSIVPPANTLPALIAGVAASGGTDDRITQLGETHPCSARSHRQQAGFGHAGRDVHLEHPGLPASSTIMSTRVTSSRCSACQAASAISWHEAASSALSRAGAK